MLRAETKVREREVPRQEDVGAKESLGAGNSDLVREQTAVLRQSHLLGCVRF
jgi:hypothetical protein